MAKFKVTISESRDTVVFIEAETRDEAWEIADHKYDNNELFYGQYDEADLVDIYVPLTPIKED